MSESLDVVVAVDLGSSGVRCIAFDADYRMRACTSRELSTLSAADGTSSQRWTDIVDATLAALSQLALVPGLIVRAISLSGTASSIASSTHGAGSERHIGDVMLWSDTRAARLPPEDSSAAVDRYERTLCPEHISYWPAKLRWLLSETDDRSRSALEFAGAKDYLFEYLTGLLWTDPMTAAATGVFDSAAWQWDKPTLASLGVSALNLPEVRPAVSQAPLTVTAASTCGIPPGAVVVLGGMDGALAQLGAAGFSTGIATCTVGTSIAYRQGVAERTVDPSARVWCYPVTPDFWVVGGAGSNGGNVFTWLAATLGGADSVGEMVEDALLLESEPGLLFLPYLNAERAPLWRSDLRSAIVGLAAHHGAADIARAALDGVGAAALELSRNVTAVLGQADEVRLSGGFLRNPAWAQLVTDALGTPTSVPDPEAATAAGAAIVGWLAVDQGAAAERPTRSSDHRRPEPCIHAALDAKAAVMRAVREALYPERSEAHTLPIGAL